MRPEVHIFIAENMEIWKTNKKLFIKMQMTLEGIVWGS